MFRITVSCGSEAGLAISREVPRRPLAFFLGGAARPDAPLQPLKQFPEQRRAVAPAELFEEPKA